MGTVVGVCSLGGAPGVTTLTVALASMWPGPVPTVCVEADAAGGTLAAWRSMPIIPGVMELAAAARHAPQSPTPHGHTAAPFAFSHTLPGGLRACLAPPTADRASAAVQQLSMHPQVLRPGDNAVSIVDLGRLTPRSATARLASQLDAVVLAVDGSDLAHLKRAHESLPGVHAGLHHLGVAVVGGGEPPRQIEAAMPAPVWGHVPRDPRGAALVRGERGDRRPHRRPLMRAARDLAQHLANTTLWISQEVPTR